MMAKSTNIQQRELRKNAKRIINDVLAESGFTLSKIYNEINEKFGCDLNKDTFRKTLSCLDDTFNIYCVIYFCKYFNIDMNSIFNSNKPIYTLNDNVHSFPLTKSSYKIFMRNPDNFSSEICEGKLEIIKKEGLPIRAVLALPLKCNDMTKYYKSTYIEDKQNNILTMFFSSERGAQVILHLHFKAISENSDWNPFPIYQGCFISDYGFGMMGKLFICDNSIELEEIDKERLSALLKFELDKIVISQKSYMELLDENKCFNKMEKILNQYDIIKQWGGNYIINVNEILHTHVYRELGTIRHVSHEDIFITLLELIKYSYNPQKILLNNNEIQRFYLYNYSMKSNKKK